MSEQRYRIFLSSPGDVAPERERAEAVVRALDAELSGISLELVRWEDRVYTAAATYQDQIIDPRECDLVLCLFWYRLGTPLPPQYNRPDGSPRSGTEYEFERAIGVACSPEDAERHEPPHVLVYRKLAPLPDEEDAALAEYRALQSFWRRWFRDEEGHYLAAFDTFTDTDAFAQNLESKLRRWLEEQRRARWDVDLHGSPFRGLAAFDEHHAEVFFGRRREVERARARLMAAAERGRSSLLILGASGSGKSSLMRAGLLPRLMVPSSTAPLVDRWRRVLLSPAALRPDVATGLVRALLDPEALPELDDELARGELTRGMRHEPEQLQAPIERALDHYAARLAETEGHRRAPTTGLLLAVDQLEECFDLDPGECENLLAVLDALVASPRVWLVATLRSDFYPRLQQDARLVALKDGGRVLDLQPPSPGDLREMIEGAAAAAGLQLEDDGERNLAGLLEAEAGPEGALPMLQFALQELFERRDRATGLLRLADYDAIGGAAGALATAGDRLLETQAETAFEPLLWRLVDLDPDGAEQIPRARTVPWVSVQGEPEQERLAEAMLEARLLVALADPESGERLLRVAHESLFRDWPRAVRAIRRLRRDLETRARLERSRQLWQGASPEERSGRLLSGLALAEAEDLLQRRGSELSDELQAYIATSLEDAGRRRRTRHALVAGVFLALAGLAGSATWFGISAEQAREEAEQAQARAQQVTVLQQELLEDIEPETVAGGVVEQLRAAAEEEEDSEQLRETFDRLAAAASLVDGVRDLLIEQVLQPAEGRMTVELADSPVMHARLQRTLADIYRNWGEFEESKRLAENARDVLDRQLGASNPATLEAMASVAETHREQGEYQRARDLQEQAREAWQAQSVDGSSAGLLDSTLELAYTLYEKGNYEQALELQEQAVRGYRERAGEDDPDTLNARLMYSRSLFSMGRLEEAREIEEDLVERRLAVSGPTHPDTLLAKNSLAVTLFTQGEYERARELEETVLERRRQVLGRQHPETLTAMSNLAVTLNTLGEYAEAGELRERVVTLRERVLGQEHPDTLIARGNLANSLKRQGEYAAARELEEGVVAMAAQVLGKEHPHTLTARHNLAMTLYRMEDYRAAREMQEQVLDTERELLGEDHPHTLGARHNLARILRDKGRTQAAREQFETALTGKADYYGRDHPDTLETARRLVALLEETGEPETAREVFEQYLEWLLAEEPEELDSTRRAQQEAIDELGVAGGS